MIWTRASLLGGALGLAVAACGGATKVPAPLRAAPMRNEVPTRVAKGDVVTPPVVTPEPLPLPEENKGERVIGSCADKGPMRFSLAHVNDLQARYSERIGGKSRYAYLAGTLRKAKLENPNTLILDAGDDYEKGSLVDLRSMGEATRSILQLLPIDVRTIGNHDFAYGEAAVLRDVRESAHPVLSANIARGEGKGPFAPYARFRVGCVRVGVIGMTTYNYGADDLPTKEPYDGVFHYDDRLWQVLDEQAKAHRSEVDVLIALTHLGTNLDLELARAVPSIDIFVGGHSEDLFRDPLGVAKSGTMTYIVQAGHYARYVGRGEVTVSPDRKVTLEKYRLVSIDNDAPPADDVHEAIDHIERKYVPDLHGPLGKTKSTLSAGRPLADVLWKAVKELWGADALLVGKDQFWDALPEGEFSLQRLYETVLVQRQPAGTPGFSSLYLVAMPSAELRGLVRRMMVAGPNGLASQIPGLPPPPEYLVYGGDPPLGKTLRVAIEKRLLWHPVLGFYGSPKLPQGRFAGELIDVLEAYATKQRDKGLFLTD